MEENAIQVYELATAGALFELRDRYRRILFDSPGSVDQREKVFTVSPTSGALSFTDYTRVWKSRNGTGLPPSREEAIAAAENFLDAANRKTADFNRGLDNPVRSLFPDRNQRALRECHLVLHQDGRWHDHWLCLYEIRVLAGTAATQGAYVYGMGLDLRIGANGRVISFHSRWRPVKRTLYTDRLPADAFAFLLQSGHHHNGRQQTDHPQPQHHTPHGEPGHSHAPEPVVYLYDGDAGNQYYLSPYYYRADGHHLQVAPASKFSLVIRLLQEETPNRTRVTARVYGGSGNYLYHWAYWNPATLAGTEAEHVVLGEGSLETVQQETGTWTTSTVTLPKGFYNLMLHVADRQTGAYCHHQQTIFSTLNSNSDARVS